MADKSTKNGVPRTVEGAEKPRGQPRPRQDGPARSIESRHVRTVRLKSSCGWKCYLDYDGYQALWPAVTNPYYDGEDLMWEVYDYTDVEPNCYAFRSKFNSDCWLVAMYEHKVYMGDDKGFNPDEYWNSLWIIHPPEERSTSNKIEALAFGNHEGTFLTSEYDSYHWQTRLFPVRHWLDRGGWRAETAWVLEDI